MKKLFLTLLMGLIFSINSFAVDAVDINTATEAQLRVVPGIGQVYAAKIIANRPYGGKDELVTKNIIPKALYPKVKDKLIAKQIKK